MRQAEVNSLLLLFTLILSINSFCRACLPTSMPPARIIRMYSELSVSHARLRFFKPLRQKSFLSPQSNSVTLPSIYRTTQFFKPICVSLGGSKKPDNNTALTCKIINRYGVYVVSKSYFPSLILAKDFCYKIWRLENVGLCHCL